MSWLGIIAGGLVMAAVGLLSLRDVRPSTRDARFATRRTIGALGGERSSASRVSLGVLATARWRPTRTSLQAPAGGSVVVFGATQSGKTSSIVIPALLDWPGPVLAASVKDDLLLATRTARSARGPIGVLDPERSGRGSVCFDPVHLVRSWPHARRLAHDLAEASLEGASSAESTFWIQLASKMLAAMLWAASLERADLATVARWVDTRDEWAWLGVLEADPHRRGLDAGRASVARDERQLGSVYATVETILEPLLVDGDASVPAVDPTGLLAERGTLYLCAPAHEQRRHRAMFSAVSSEVLRQGFALAREQGGALSDPLLVVLDEAAAIAPLAELDVVAATCASHGITLVTCFQDLAQVRARWGERASTVVNNHRTRVMLSGLADPAAAELLGSLAGHAEVRTKGRSSNSAPERRALIESHELRAAPVHRGIVVSGGIDPARLALVPYWERPAPLGPTSGRWLGSGRAHLRHHRSALGQRAGPAVR